MSSYFSIGFIAIAFPLIVACYGVVPRRFRWAVLLAASYGFFWYLSRGLVVFVVAATLVVYASGLAIGSIFDRRKAALAQAEKGGKKQVRARYKRYARIVVALGTILCLGMLIALKYLGFFGECAAGFLGLFGVQASFEVARIGIPIGISFYTLMAVSYIVDVYRETIAPDRHLGRVALFLCFFPQIMEGPICRYGQTAEALYAGAPITRSNLHAGTLRILVGFAKKLIVADRLNLFVKPVFDDYGMYDGCIVALGAVLYTLQLYCDFSGTMDVAIGLARVFGVNLPENFRQPFFSRTAAEFWQRWHITLGTWLKDYVYYPVSLSKPVKNLTARARKRFGTRYGPLLTSSIALFCVWFGNGLWHGAGSQYLFFGMYYFVLILLGGLIDPLAQQLAGRLGIDRNAGGYRAFQIARTLVVIFVGELFFRANGMDAGLAMFAKMVTDFGVGSFADGTVLGIGMDGADFAIVAVFAALVLVLDIMNERGKNLYEAMQQRSAAARWALCAALLLAIVVFGAYGFGYAPVDPMYAQF